MAKAEAEAVLDAPEGEQRERRRNRPPKNKPPRRRQEETETEGGPTFWQKVGEVAKADWGPRANIYAYRIEPMIDRARSGNNNYIMKYAEPISEDRIMADHGSGKYKLMLNFRKPGADQGDEVDSVYIDLLNMQYPPKVPPGEWVDDPRNKKWAWAKQHFPREGNERPTETIMEALNLADRVRGAQQQGDPVKATLDTIKAVRELSPPPAKSPTEELNMLVTVAEKLRPQETVPAFMQAQFTALQSQITAAQERGDKLLMILLEDRRKGTSDNGGFGAIKQVTDGLKELLPAVKEFFPNLGDSVGTGGGGSRLNGWQEFAVAIANAPVVSGIVTPLAGAFAQALIGRFMGPAPGPHATTQQHQPAQPHPPAGALPAGNMPPFIEMIAPPMMNYIRNMALPGYVPADLGHDFGSWVFDGYGGDARYGEALMSLKAMGPAGIIAAMQSTTQLWNNKGPNGMLVSPAELQAKLPEFFTGFLAYDPNAEAEDEEETDEPPQVVAFSEASA